MTNLNDSGAGSLRNAINQANSLPVGYGTITFLPSLFNGGAQTLTLTSGPIDITGDLDIYGPGANLLTVSGNQSEGVFDVSSPDVGLSSPFAPPPGTTIYSLTIAEGSGNGGFGFANVRNTGTLTLEDCPSRRAWGARTAAALTIAAD